MACAMFGLAKVQKEELNASGAGCGVFSALLVVQLANITHFQSREHINAKTRRRQEKTRLVGWDFAVPSLFLR